MMTGGDDAALAPTESPEPILQASNVHKRFGDHTVLDGVSLELRPGGCLGLLGRNGAGKSTLIEILLGVTPPDQGVFRFEGTIMRRLGAEQRRSIGYVPQTPSLYPWMNAVELGRFVGRFYPDWDRALFEAGLERFQVPRRTRFAQLSGGTRAKLALLLAIGHRPRVLILDEPTAGLDPVARHEFRALLQQWVDGQYTVLISSHLVGDLEQVATEVAILEGGRFVRSGSPASLVSDAWVMDHPPAGVSSFPLGPQQVLVRAPQPPAGARSATLEEVFVAAASRAETPVAGQESAGVGP